MREEERVLFNLENTLNQTMYKTVKCRREKKNEKHIYVYMYKKVQLRPFANPEL